MISVTHRIFFIFVCSMHICQCATKPRSFDAVVEVPNAQNLQPNTHFELGYRLQAGDEIDLFVLEDSGFNGKYPIRASGDVILPKLGRVQVVGKTLSEAEQAIKSSLEQSNLKQATVILDPGKRDGQHVTAEIVVRLAGSVAKSGRVSIPVLNNTAITAYQAIMDVGGFAPFANKKKAYIIRTNSGGTQRIDINFEKIEKGILPDLPVQSGDSIIVPQKMFGF